LSVSLQLVRLVVFLVWVPFDGPFFGVWEGGSFHYPVSIAPLGRVLEVAGVLNSDFWGCVRGAEFSFDVLFFPRAGAVAGWVIVIHWVC